MSVARRQKINRGWGDDIAPIPVTKIDAELYGALREVEGDQLILQDGKIQIGAFRLTSTGLEMNQDANKDEWDKVGEMLFRLEGSIQWLVGDWLVYGAGVHYGDLEAFSSQIEKDYGTLRNYASVARNVDLSLRNDKLSYHHHVAVSKLTPEQQDYALKHVAQHPMPVAKFRQWINEQLGVAAVPALTTGAASSLKALSGDFDKLAQRDPSKAKPEDHKKARQVYAEAQQVIRDFGRKWGIE